MMNMFLFSSASALCLVILANCLHGDTRSDHLLKQATIVLASSLWRVAVNNQ